MRAFLYSPPRIHLVFVSHPDDRELVVTRLVQFVPLAARHPPEGSLPVPRSGKATSPKGNSSSARLSSRSR